MQTSWLIANGKTYYLAPTTGARQTGWQTIDGKDYYFDADGIMAAGWTVISEKTYYLGTDGARRVSSWITDTPSGKKRYRACL